MELAGTFGTMLEIVSQKSLNQILTASSWLSILITETIKIMKSIFKLIHTCTFNMFQSFCPYCRRHIFTVLPAARHGITLKRPVCRELILLVVFNRVLTLPPLYRKGLNLQLEFFQDTLHTIFWRRPVSGWAECGKYCEKLLDN